MPTPKVGKVNLEAGIDWSSLRGELTQAVAKEVIPQIQGMATSVADVRKQINAIDNTKVATLARDAGIVRKQSQETSRALQEQAKHQARLAKLEEKRDKAAEKRTEMNRLARRKANKEDEAFQERLRKARQAVKDVDTAIRLERMNTARIDDRIADAKLADQNRYLKEVEKERDVRRSVHEEAIKLANDQASEVLRIARKQSDDILTEAHRMNDKIDRDRASANRRAEREAQQSAKRIANAQIREANRAARAKRRLDEKSGFIAGIADLGRTTGAVRHLAVPAGILSLSGILGQLVSTLATASQAIAALPAGIAAVGAVSLTTKLGLEGVDDALGALLKNDPEKLATAMKKLAPGAQEFMQAIEQALPLFKDLQQATQNTLFGPEVAQGLRDLASQFQPVVKELTVGIADSLSDMFGNMAAGLMAPETQMALYEFVGNIVNMFEQLEPAIQPLTKAIAILLGEGSDVFPQIAGAISDAAIAFSDFVKEASRSGALNDFLRDGVDALGTMVGWVKLLVVEFFKLGPVGKEMLPEIDRLIRAIIEALPDIITFLSRFASHTESWIGLLTLVESICEGLTFTFGDIDGAAFSLGGTIESMLNPLKRVNDLVQIIWFTAKQIYNLIPFLEDIDPSVTLSDGTQFGVPTEVLMGNLQESAQAKLDAARERAERFGAPGINSQLRPVAATLGPAGHTFMTGGLGGAARYFPNGRSGWSGELEGDQAVISDSELKKQIANSIPFEDFAVDPYAPIGGIQNMPGMPGRTPMTVTVDNMPTGGMFPGMSGIPGMPGMLGGGVSSSNPIAQQILSTAFARGYNNDQALAILSTAIQESGLDPNAEGGGGAWHGIFQQDSSYPNRKDPTTNINSFFDRLAKHGGNQGDIWKNIFWLQQRPGENSADAAFNNGRQAYLSEIMGPLKDGRLEKLLTSMASPSMPAGMPMGMPGSIDLHGADPHMLPWAQMAMSAPFGLKITSGKDDHVVDGGWHPKGDALDLSNGTGPTPQMRAFAEYMMTNFAPMIEQLIYSDDQGDIGLLGGKPFDYDADGSNTFSQHRNHVHLAIKEGMEAMIGQIVPKSFKDSLYAQNGPLTMDPATGERGYFQVDQQAVMNADIRVREAAQDLQTAMHELAVAEELRRKELITDLELMEKRNEVTREATDLEQAQMDLADAQRGTFKKSDSSSQSLSIDDFAYGDPRRAMVGALSGMGMSAGDIGAIMGAAGKPLGQFVGNMGSAVAGFPLPGPMGMPGTPTAPSTDLGQLAHEGNPMFWAQAAGFNVPDYSRAGGDPSALNVMSNGGPSADAQGRMYSDTAALIDRTFTNMDAAAKARHDQVITVLNAVRERLSEEVLGPVLEDGVSGGLAGMGNGVTESIGTALGHSAGPIIAQYVAAAIPSGSGNSSGTGIGPLVTDMTGTAVHGLQNGMAPGPAGFVSFDTGMDTGFHSLPSGYGPLGGLYDEGGLWPSGTFGTNLSGAPERVLDPSQTRLFDAGLLGGWNLQPMQQHMATVSGVDVTDTVGADMIGVGQVPILGALVNILVSLLLKIIGVEIQARDTLNELSTDFRTFRGDFVAFDAAGRLMNDTSGLVDRTGSSEQAAADERIRILKIVIEALIKFIIEKLVVPISKAVANTAIQAGAQAASGAISGAGNIVPGGTVASGAVGSMVGSAISSAGSAAVDIIADVGSNLAVSLVGVAVEGLADMFQSGAPNLARTIFGGSMGAGFFDPITNTLTGIMGGLTALFGGLFGGVSDMFDSGGMATGVGMMPKATIRPERVLSPQQTMLFERMVTSLERGGRSPGRSTSIHAPITMVVDHERAGDRVQSKLMELMS